MSDLESIIVKVTSSPAYFGEPSVIRVILEKMIPLVVGQANREILFIHREVAVQEVAVVVKVHEAGPVSASDLVERYLAQMTNPKLSFVVEFASTTELTDEANFGQIVASTEAKRAFENFVAHANSMSTVSEYTDESVDYQECLWNELIQMKMPWEMDPAERQYANYVVDELSGIVGRQLGLD